MHYALFAIVAIYLALLLFMDRCPVCNSIYRHSSGLNRHMRLKHYTTRKKYLSDHPDDVPARTSTALLDSVSKVPVPGLGKDEQVVTGQDNDDDDACTSDDVPSFKTKLVVGGSSSQRSGVFKCAYCSHASKSLGDMRRHRRMHSVVKRFKCSYCPKKYKYIGDLNIHLQRDHEVNLSVRCYRDLPASRCLHALPWIHS